MTTSDSATVATATEAYPKPAVAWYATLALALLYWLSILDRFIISLLVEPIKRDMQISDLQFSLLHGIAFAITYSIFGLVAGALADRYSRRRIIFCSVAIWSLATAACGAVAHYWQLLLARVGVGAGEAGLTPSATSILSDLFPRERLTMAMAVFTIGATIGSGTAYLFGGLIVEAVSQSPTFNLPLIGEVRSWQAVFYIIGIPGVALAFVAFSFPEPQRRQRRAAPKETGLLKGVVESYRELLQFMSSQKRFFMHHYSGFALGSMVMSGSAIWYPAHMGRTFGMGPAEIGLWLGSVVVVASIIGKMLTGFVVDKLYQRGYRDGQFRWFGGSMLIAAPIGILAMQAESSSLFLTLIGVFVGLMAALPACYSASLNLATPNELRGTGIAFFCGTSGLIGMSLGPMVMATASQLFFGENAIGAGIATVMAVCCPLAALLLLSGCKAMRQAVTAQEQ